MLRSILLMLGLLMAISGTALSQQSQSSPQPGGGATTVETTAPGGLTTVTLEFNNKITAPTHVWVDGNEVPLNQWEWEFVGTNEKKIRITFDNAPPKDKKVEVRVDYPGAKPELNDANTKWS